MDKCTLESLSCVSAVTPSQQKSHGLDTHEYFLPLPPINPTVPEDLWDTTLKSPVTQQYLNDWMNAAFPLSNPELQTKMPPPQLPSPWFDVPGPADVPNSTYSVSVLIHDHSLLLI